MKFNADFLLFFLIGASIKRKKNSWNRSHDIFSVNFDFFILYGWPKILHKKAMWEDDLQVS